MGWRDRLADAKDTVADAKFRATDRFVRCPKKDGAEQCQLSRGHKGKHEHGRKRW